MKFYHLISIFIAIYLQNIGNEVSADIGPPPPLYPENCQAHNQIPCYDNYECNDLEIDPRHPHPNTGVCKNVRNTHATGDHKRCVCRRKGCDHGDICETNRDCGLDKWNRKGKCVITKRPNKDGDFVFGDIVMSGTHYRKTHGQWRNHKHCECPPPKFPGNCEGNFKNPCTYNKQCGEHGVCTRYYGGTGKKYCVCRRPQCAEGDICKKDNDCGTYFELDIGRRGTCEKTITDRSKDDLWLYTDMRRCKCGSKPKMPTTEGLEEAVAETQRIGNETQRMLKVGSKWLKNLYNAHLEENHDFKKEDTEEKDGHWKKLEENNGFGNFGEY